MKWGTQGYSDFIREYPIFPLVRKLQEAVEHIKFESGILEEIFDVIRCQISRMSPYEMYCIVALDEMAIKPGQMYDSTCKRIIGSCTFPGHTGLAKEPLVILLAGITTRWKYAVAYYFTNKINSEAKQTGMLQEMH
ncbi:vam6 vps39-like protein [Lasius niger]|uniref:Vam6 vps39-like protein n=1 Tax=Lasius niger TaxID=67767 RepID=A0A0J7KF67_LASNI|nr:vam6 vps39-like protein [Lasius niger]